MYTLARFTEQYSLEDQRRAKLLSHLSLHELRTLTILNTVQNRPEDVRRLELAYSLK